MMLSTTGKSVIKPMTFIVPPQEGQVKGSTSKTLRRISAQPRPGDLHSLLINEDEGMLIGFCLAHLAPVAVGVDVVISHSDLTLLKNMRGHPGDELQVVHLLHISGLFPIPVADPGEAPPASTRPTPQVSWHGRTDRTPGCGRRTSTIATRHSRDSGCGQSRNAGCRNRGNARPPP
jgi:hypothetical protein